MLKYVKNMQGKRQRKKARAFIHNTMRKKFNTTITKQLTIKLPYTKNIPIKTLMGLMNRILKKSSLHPYLKIMCGPKTRFVYTKRNAIKDIFENNTRLARSHGFERENKATLYAKRLTLI